MVQASHAIRFDCLGKWLPDSHQANLPDPSLPQVDWGDAAKPGADYGFQRDSSPRCNCCGRPGKKLKKDAGTIRFPERFWAKKPETGGLSPLIWRSIAVLPCLAHQRMLGSQGVAAWSAPAGLR